MTVFNLPLDPPLDDYEIIVDILLQACEEFLGNSYKSGKFEKLFDLMFEEVSEHLDQYQEPFYA